MTSYIIDVIQKGLDSESYPFPKEINILSDERNFWINHSSLKGASLLHMIASLSPNKDLREGINSYLEKWSSGVTTSDHLWESFNNIFNKQLDITKFSKNWLKEGYPVVGCQYKKQNGQVLIDEMPFYLQHPPSDNSAWDIPITYTTKTVSADLVPKKIWLKGEDTALKFVLQMNDSWILINLPEKGLYGFFRVNYDLNNWHSLEIEFLNENNILQEETKAELLDDSYQLAKAGRLPYSVPLNMTLKALKKATLLTLRTIDTHLTFLQQFFEDRNSNETFFKDFVQTLFRPQLKELNLDILTNNLTQNYIKEILLKWTCRYDIPECINWAIPKFKSWMQNKIALKSLPDEVLRTGIRNGTSKDLEIVFDRSLSQKILPKERLRLLKSLTYSRNASFIMGLLESTLQLKPNIVKRKYSDEDVIAIWESAWENLEVKDHVFRLFFVNWNDIYEKYHANNKVLSAIIRGATEGLTEEHYLTDVTTIKERVVKKFNVALNSLQDALNKMIVKTAWRNTKLDSVLALFQ